MSHDSANFSTPGPLLASGVGSAGDGVDAVIAEAEALRAQDIACEKGVADPASGIPTPAPTRQPFALARHAADGTADPHGATVMMTDNGVVLCKWITADRSDTIAAAEGYTYDAREVHVENLRRLLTLLRRVAQSRHSMIVRGTLIDGPEQKGILRRRISQPHEPATIRDGGRLWICVDVEKVPLPDGVDIHDLPACARILIPKLPPEFHGVTCIAQASSGHGVKRGKDGRYEIRLHLWFWLSRPVLGMEAKAWLTGRDFVDISVFWPEHILYTAPPLFKDGKPDHIRPRYVMVPSDRDVVTVPKIEWTPRNDGGPLVVVGTPGKPPEPTIPLDVLRDAVAIVLGESKTNREEWRNTGFALCHETGGSEEGWQLYRELTLAHPRCGTQDGEEGAAADIWKRGQIPHPRPCTVGTILKLVRKIKGDPNWFPKGWRREYDRRLSDGSEFETSDMPADSGGAGQRADGGTVDQMADDGRVDAGEGPPVLSRATPVDSAREFLRRHYQHDYYRTLHYHGKEWFVWSGGRYVKQEDLAIKARLYTFLDDARVWIKKEDGQFVPAPFNPRAKDIRDILDALQSAAHLDEKIKAPAWTDNKPHPPAIEFFCVANGLLHLPTKTLHPHSPAYFGVNVVDYPYDPGAAKPREWLKFLRLLWPDDSDAIDTLHEMFGYFVSGNTSLQKMFMLIGPPRSGKSTIGRVLTRLLGAENVAGPTLASFATDFGLQELIGKPLAIIADARLSSRADPTPIIERQLAISGEDTLTIPRKFLPAWTGKLPTRLLTLTNELPALMDASGALSERYIVWQLTESYLGREDHGLFDRLLPERAGILNVALDGWRRLNDRGHFAMPKCAAATVETMKAASSPILAFLAECTVSGPDKQVARDHLFAAWVAWCERNGRRNAGNKASFGVKLHAARPKLSKSRPRDEDDPARPRVYEGIALTDSAMSAAGIFAASDDKPQDGKGIQL